jgi:hypothetical protein
VRYELLLQPLEPGLPWEPERIEPLLQARGVTAPDAAGARTWKLKEGLVELRPLRDGGAIRGLELHVSFSDKTELVREVTVEGSALAKEAGLRLLDPQLSRTVTAADAESVADQFLRTARYAGEMLGVPEAIDASFGAPAPGSSTGMKVIFGIIALVFVALWLLDFLSSRFS